MSIPNWYWRDLKPLHYRTILIDPPWKYETRSDAGQGRSAGRHYKTMTFDELAALPVADLAMPDALVAIWVTDTHLVQGIELMKAWGIEYSTIGFVWLKTNQKTDPERLNRVAEQLQLLESEAAMETLFFMGMGHWTRANPEICLLGKFGDPSRLKSATNVRSIIVEPLREHSRKPDAIYTRLRRLHPGPGADLFGRLQGDDYWDVFGDQAGLFGERPHD